MISAIFSAVSGLVAQRMRLDVSANNVANLNTNNFKKSRVVLESTQPAGVRASVQQVNTPGVPIPDGFAVRPGDETSNVDLVEETVTQIGALQGFRANLNIVRAADQMLKHLIDTFR
ncbi:MAG: flagellar basal body rod C-terminal domain-containing protein [Candidatus Methylomirabilia bacterium]